MDATITYSAATTSPEPFGDRAIRYDAKTADRFELFSRHIVREAVDETSRTRFMPATLPVALADHGDSI
ncbi:MAG: hypothetical protein LLG97_10340 [Deltaproteobacteria bacterium]|nr:hypothetical protein [Deltaproteobacteria bacterium]